MGQSYFLIVILLFFNAGSSWAGTTPSSACEDDSWYPFKDDKCVKFVDQLLPHDVAQQVCLESFGSQLAEVKSVEEQEFLSHLLFQEYQVVDNVWLGATRRLLEVNNGTEFEWGDGLDLQYTHWAADHPTDDPEKNCSQLTSHLSLKGVLVDVKDGEWMDVSCLKRNLVVCQKYQNWSVTDLQKIVRQIRSDMDALHLSDVIADPTSIKNCMDVQSPQFFPEALSSRFVLRNKKYDIYPPGLILVDPDQKVGVQCDFETDGGGWTVILRRRSGPIDQFYLGWTDYEEGFGDVDENYWIGLKPLHALTSNGRQQELRVELGDWDGTHGWAQYSSFRVGNSTDLYRLSVGGYRGNVGDGLIAHNGRPFSTKDKDNDESAGSCAVDAHGAWWYTNCATSTLTGYYYPNSTAIGNEGLNWQFWKGDSHSLKNVEMKIRDFIVYS